MLIVQMTTSSSFGPTSNQCLHNLQFLDFEGQLSRVTSQDLNRSWISSAHRSMLWDVVGHLQGSKAFSLENSEKSLKRGCRGLSALRSTYPPKKSKTSRKRAKKPEKNLKNSHFRLFFEPFLTPGPRGPGNPFSDFVGVSQGKAF